MKLSVIIVNYNVKFFLEQCLHSVLKAANEINMETFVVDNNSVDGSVSMLKEKFPSIKVIANKDIIGFLTQKDILKFKPELFDSLDEITKIREQSEKLKRHDIAEQTFIKELNDYDEDEE